MEILFIFSTFKLRLLCKITALFLRESYYGYMITVTRLDDSGHQHGGSFVSSAKGQPSATTIIQMPLAKLVVLVMKNPLYGWQYE